MKKIFTLIAVATMAISANAQEQYKIEKDWVPTKSAQTEIANATESTSIIYSDDPGWKASNPSSGGFASTKGYEAGVSGGQNPKDGGYDGGKSAGAGYKPESKNLPNAGVYYIVKASKAGDFELSLKIGDGKNFYICEPDGTALSNTAIKGVTENGDQTLGDDYIWSDAGEFFVTFTAEADKSYYVFCTGSKLTIYGYTFTPAGSTGINTVKTAAEDGAVYNLAGQKVSENYKGVVIKNGRKIIQ